MKTLSRREFEQRWRTTQKASRQVVANTSVRRAEVSMETILDRYAAVLERAVAEHLVEKSVCDEVCRLSGQLKEALKNVDDEKIAHIKRKRVLS